MNISELTQLIRVHESELLRFAVAILRDEALAQDAVQGAFIALAERLFTPADPCAWLYKVTRNKALNILRSRKKFIYKGEVPEETDNPAPSPEAELACSERKANLQKAVDELPPGQRVVLILRYYENLSYAEISRRTGSAPGTVASQLHDALAAISAKVKKGDVL